MSRVYNFSAGPAAMPELVLAQAQAEMLDWHGTGMSVMEMSHRGADFMAIAAEAEADLRDLLAIPAAYQVLFLQGGASLQFSMLPMNLVRGLASVDYIDTGDWSLKAIAAAKTYAKVNVVASSAATNYTSIPTEADWQCDPKAAYLHYTANETMRGVEFQQIPATGVPLVSDMSSNILSRPVDVSRFGMIYAGAQKNIGPAGLTVVIIRSDLLGHAVTNTPKMLDYKVYADNGSMLNTPPTYAWYLAGLVFKWLKQQGGLSTVAVLNQRKAALLYQYLDGSGFYHCPVQGECRSWMNVPFILQDAKLDATFLTESVQAGLVGLKGHRDVGGMRASLYNATSEAAVLALVDFMRDFARRYG